MSEVKYLYSFKNLVLHLEGCQERYENRLQKEENVKTSQREAAKRLFKTVPTDKKLQNRLYLLMYADGLDKIRNLMAPEAPLTTDVQTFEGASKWCLKHIDSLELHYKFPKNTKIENLIGKDIESVEGLVLLAILNEIVSLFSISVPKFTGPTLVVEAPKRKRGRPRKTA